MKNLCGLLVMLLIPAAASADVEVSAELSTNQARVGEQIILTVIVEGAVRGVSDPMLPQIPGVTASPAGTSTNMSIVNGKVTRSKSYTYLLFASKPGKYVVGEITVEHKDTTYKTRPQQLTVLASNAPSTSVPDEAKGTSSGTEDVFVRASVDKENPYVYEQVTLKLLIYSRLAFMSNPSFSMPDAGGFWKENLPARDVRIVTIEGRRYQLLEVDLALFPTRSGRLEIGASQVSLTVQSNDRRRDPFGFRRGKQVQLETKPITLDVKALPPGAPEGFDGAVGDYVLEVQADKVQVEQNEPILLNVKVSGNGNLRTVNSIIVPDLPQFRTYPEELVQSQAASGTTLGGMVRQKIVLVPLSAGDMQVPPLKLVTFSPRAGEYKVLQSKPLTFRVSPGASQDGYAGSVRSGIEVVGRDIRFIVTEPPKFAEAGRGPGSAVWPLWLMSVPALAYAGVVVWDRHRRRLGTDVAYRRQSKAYKIAKQCLSNVPAGSEGAGAAAEAVKGYLADLWNVPAASLTVEGLAAKCSEMGIESAPIQSFLDECDAVRFAPDVRGAGGDYKTRALALVKNVEDAR